METTTENLNLFERLKRLYTDLAAVDLVLLTDIEMGLVGQIKGHLKVRHCHLQLIRDAYSIADRKWVAHESKVIRGLHEQALQRDKKIIAAMTRLRDNSRSDLAKVSVQSQNPSIYTKRPSQKRNFSI